MKQLIKNIVRWARITKAGSDDKQFATQQMEYLGKVADGIIVFPYGLHGNVPADSLALMFAVQGNPDNRAAIAWTPKDRPKLSDGEVAFYHPPTDAFIIWRTTGDLDIETGNSGTANVNIKCKKATVTASESVTVDTPEADFTGNVTVAGNIDVTGNNTVVGNTSTAGLTATGATSLTTTVTSGGVNIGGTHTHTQANDSGGNTEQDTGVPQ